MNCNSLQNTKTLKNSDKLTKNDVNVVRNKIMHNNIQFDTNQVNVLYEIQINTTKRENIVLRTVTNRLAS